MAKNEQKTLELNPKSEEEQIKRLNKLFPGSKFDYENGRDYGFVLPAWKSIAGSYQKSLEKVFDKIDDLEGIDFVNCHLGKQDVDNLRHNEHTFQAFERVLTAQNCEKYVVMPAQIGLENLGKSPEEVLNEITGENFGLTAFHVGIILLTHFDRIAGGGDLWINCPGDEIVSGTKKEFNHVPFFTVTNKKIWFCGHDKSCKIDRFGSATTLIKPLGEL